MPPHCFKHDQRNRGIDTPYPLLVILVKLCLLLHQISILLKFTLKSTHRGENI